MRRFTIVREIFKDASNNEEYILQFAFDEVLDRYNLVKFHPKFTSTSLRRVAQGDTTETPHLVDIVHYEDPLQNLVVRQGFILDLRVHLDLAHLNVALLLKRNDAFIAVRGSSFVGIHSNQ